MIAFDDVTKTFGESRAVDGVTLTVPEGRTTALIGPSGCGKSTLLRMVVGLETPTSGDVFVDGVAVEPSSVRAIRRRLGYVIQEGGLFPHLTAKQNVLLAVEPLGIPPADFEARLEELIRLTHLPVGAIDRYPGELSGGQRQRVSIIRALLPDPDYLLMDEPFGALDPLVRFELQREFRDIVTSEGKTVLLVTHDLAEAGFLGDEVVLLEGGRVVQQGPYRDLLESPVDEFVTRFVEAQRTPEAAS